MQRRVAIVTGANSGIGRETALALAERGFKVFLACRSEDRARPVLDELASRGHAGAEAELLVLDLASLRSVREAARSFLDRELPLHALVNNAGIVARGLSEDGFELIFGVNHVGHFLFTQLLLETLEASAPARVVNVSSDSHYGARAIDWEALRQPTRTTTGLHEYEVSKAANVLFTRELARRYRDRGVHAYAIHPGRVGTNVWRRVPWPIRPLIQKLMLTPAQGARGVIRAAASDDASSETGLYYDHCDPKEPSALARDDELARELWERSIEWTRPSRARRSSRSGSSGNGQ